MIGEQSVFPPVLRIHDILVWIRIRGSMPLRNPDPGSGSWIQILDPDPAIFVIDIHIQDARKKLGG